jgi:monofunctional biosynthetic peptidoglycan transglycosylase
MPRRPSSVGGRIGRGVLALAAMGFAALTYSWITLPDVRPLRRTNPTSTAFIRLRADEARAAGRTPHAAQRWVSYGEISPMLKRAVLVSEDAAFWQHDGVDYEEMRLALESDWAKGGFLRGASTITQQLAKNLYLSPSRNPYRKITELLIARRLEAELPKARIFEIYLNVIEWGDDIWGAEAASRAYFGVPASALSPQQAALLAGAIINPRVYSPAHPNARLLRRQQIILGRMGDVTPPAITTPPIGTDATAGGSGSDD